MQKHTFLWPQCQNIKYSYPSLKMSASFRNAELMRIGKGYFWKSFGNSTTASHCSPSLPDRKPGNTATCLSEMLQVTINDSTHLQHKIHEHTATDQRYANQLALAHLCPAPLKQNWRQALVRHNKPLIEMIVRLNSTSGILSAVKNKK